MCVIYFARCKHDNKFIWREISKRCERYSDISNKRVKLITSNIVNIIYIFIGKLGVVFKKKTQKTKQQQPRNGDIVLITFGKDDFNELNAWNTKC
jgi:hypothetical protein